jgi:BASS family bile acid:Na+ symporter
MLVGALEWLDRRAAPLLAAALFVGILVPPLASLARPLFTPSVVLLLAATLLRIDWRRVRDALRRPLAALAVGAWLMVGCPVAMALAVAPLGLPHGLDVVAVLMASSPPLISVPAFALMVGLDAALALVLTVGTSFLLPLVQPPLVVLLLGLVLPIGLDALVVRLGLFVGGAAALALAFRLAAGPARVARCHGALGGVAVLSLLVFALAVVDGLTWTALAEPGKVALFLAAVFAANWGLQALTALVFSPAGNGLALVAAMASGNRNLAILTAALGEQAPPALFLWLAIGQFPLYLFPAVLGPVYRRLAQRV